MNPAAGEKTEEEMIQWFEKDLLTRLVAENKFPLQGVHPSNLEIFAIKWEKLSGSADHFASKPLFLRLTVCDKADANKSKEFPLVAKFIPQNVLLRVHMNIEVQFYNEMTLFNKIVPTYQKFLRNRSSSNPGLLDDVLPYCYYAHIDLDNPDYGIIILEDLREKGYNPAKSLVELDYKHCESALKQLAKFHALSYAMKIESPEEFEVFKTSSKECRYDEDKYKEKSFGLLLEYSGLRAINYLLEKKDSEVPEDYLLKLRGMVTSGIYGKLRNLVVPTEPLAVIAHGDFCRNNLLFKLKNGEADKCVLIDLATFRYSSPSFDLSFFFYMNTTLPFREKYFDELFDAYYITLIDTICGAVTNSRQEILEKYPKELFLKDFAQLSLTGYCTIAFFLPVMLYPDDFGSLEEDIKTLTDEEHAQKNTKLGGEIATKRIAEVVIDMYRRRAYMDE